MLKPVQRLPQYKLLLEDYLRRINHDSVDFDDTTIALRIVSDAADHANNTIRQGVRNPESGKDFKKVAWIRSHHLHLQ